MNLLADLLSTLSDRRYRKRAVERMEAIPVEDIAREIVTLSGETVGLTRAAALLDRFDRSTDTEKCAFFWFLATQMNIDPVTVRSALDTYETGPSRETYSTFAKAVEPARQELIRRLNQVPGATGTLVRMRADLLRLGRGVPELEALDLDFRHLFASWFNRGFLVLRSVNWQSPAHIPEKIIAYEAVHTIDSWDDLRRRV